MLQPEVRAEVDDFFEQVSKMTAAQFETVDSASTGIYKKIRDSRPLLRLSAADFSHVEKRARDVTRPINPKLVAISMGLASVSVALVQDCVMAIIGRGKLSEEQYDLWVGGFRAAGVRVPPWRGTEG
jgi:hypothetical protein